MTFDSYHWAGSDLADPSLSAARSLLAEDDPTGSTDAFDTLLDGASIAARGIALDHFRYAEASGRWGIDNPYASRSVRVLSTARELLDEPPLPAGVDGARFAGANHASALAAMVNLADPTDSARVARALRSAGEPNVREGALQIAMTVAERSAPVAPVLIDAVIASVDDRAWPWDARADALRVLYLISPGHAREHAAVLLDAPDLRMRVRAAWVLAEDDLAGHRDLLVGLAALWPEDAPYPAFEVRQLLEDASTEGD